MEKRVGNLELRQIPLELITVDESQPRSDFPEAERKELTASLLANGQKEPITVYQDGGRYIVISGARRRISAGDAGLKTLLAIVMDHQPEPSELYLHQLLANAHRVDLNPMELCSAYSKLMHLMKINASELAQTVSKSKTYVSNVLSLDTLPAELKQLIRDGKMGLAKGALIARLSHDEQAQAAVDLQNGSLTREQLERKAARRKPEGKPVQRVTLEMPAATMSLVGKAKLSVDELIDLLQLLVRECKRARSQGVDISTLSCILRDRAKMPAEGGA